jgi:hypothetical protein
VIDFGIGVADFWRLTPREFWSMLKRFEDQQRVLDYRAAAVAVPLQNSMRDVKKYGALNPDDLFPSLKPRDEAKPPPVEFQVEWLKAEVRRSGGKVIER